MIRAMLQDVRTGSATAGRRIAHRNGIWEVLGILAVVVPCGVLAGLYLATGDIRFIIGCAVLAALAVALILMRNPGFLQLSRWRFRAQSRSGAQTGDSGAARMRRIFTLPVLKLLGVTAWLCAWSVTAALYARVFEGANIGALVMLVAVGGFSPIVIYFGLEGGIKKLTSRMRHPE
jgi:hypothetical protein